MGTSESGHTSELRPTWLEIDLGALGRNFRVVRDRVAPRRVWCVVKADAYGHGAVEVARRLEEEGAEAFAVVTVDEGVELRAAGVGGDILVMAGIEPLRVGGRSFGSEAAVVAVEHSLSVAVWGGEAAAVLGEAALAAGNGPAKVHLKVDTGLGRLGVLVDDSPSEAVEIAGAVAAIDGVELSGVFSHLSAADASADQPRHQTTVAQIERFGSLCGALEDAGLLPEHRHLGHSAAILQHPAAWERDWCSGVRPGLSLYGVLPFAGRVTVSLAPVMSWYSAVASIREIRDGWPLGYGGVRRATGDRRIAVVPVGYHDGFPRTLSEKADMLVCGRRAKVVGAISMDLTLVDITGIPDVHVGSPVILLGSGPESGAEAIRAEELAGHAGTIPWDILCRVGRRVPHRFVDSSP